MEAFSKVKLEAEKVMEANEEERGRVKEEGGGVALSSLHPRYHALRLQWMYCNGEGHTAFSRVLLIF